MDQYSYYQTINLFITVCLSIPEADKASEVVTRNLSKFLDPIWVIKCQTLVTQVYDLYQAADTRAKLTVQGFKVLLSTELATDHQSVSRQPQLEEVLQAQLEAEVEAEAEAEVEAEAEPVREEVYYLVSSDGVIGEGYHAEVPSTSANMISTFETRTLESSEEIVNHNISQNTEMEVASTPKANKAQSEPQQIESVQDTQPVQYVEEPVEVAPKRYTEVITVHYPLSQQYVELPVHRPMHQPQVLHDPNHGRSYMPVVSNEDPSTYYTSPTVCHPMQYMEVEVRDIPVPVATASRIQQPSQDVLHSAHGPIHVHAPSSVSDIQPVRETVEDEVAVQGSCPVACPVAECFYIDETANGYSDPTEFVTVPTPNLPIHIIKRDGINEEAETPVEAEAEVEVEAKGEEVINPTVNRDEVIGMEQTETDKFLKSWSNHDLTESELQLLLSKSELPELRHIYSTVRPSNWGLSDSPVSVLAKPVSVF